MSTAPTDLAQIVPELGRLLGKTTATLRRNAVRRAARLARAGRYVEAEHLLGEYTSPAAASVDALDLTARIRVQQGRLGEAEALWVQAGKLAPENAALAEALAALRELQRRPARSSALRLLPVAAVVAVLLLAAGWAVRESRLQRAQSLAQAAQLQLLADAIGKAGDESRRRLDELERTQRSLVTSADGNRERLATWSADLAALRESANRTDQALSRALAAPANSTTGNREVLEKLAALERAAQETRQQQAGVDAELRNEVQVTRREIGQLAAKLTPPPPPAGPPTIASIAGIKTLARGDKLVAWFPRGTFLRGLPLLRGSAETSLRSLGSALRQAQPDDLRIEILGSATEGALFSTTEALAYKRAAIVAQHLGEFAGLPSDRVTARAATRSEAADQLARAGDPIEAESVLIVISRGK